MRKSLGGLFVSARRITGRRFLAKLVVVSGASIVISCLDAIGIMLIVPLVDRLSADSQEAATRIPVLGTISTSRLVLIVVGFLVSKTVLSAAVRYWISTVVNQSWASVSSALFRAYMGAPIEFQDRRNTSESIRTVSQTVQYLFEYGFMSVSALVTEGSTLLVLSLVVLFSTPVPALVGIGYFTVASLFYARVVNKRMKTRAKAQETLAADSIKTVQEGLSGLREHIVRGNADAFTTVFRAQRRAYARARTFITFSTELSRYYLEAVFLGGFGIIALTIVNSGSSSKALASIAILLAIGFRILPSISRLLASFANVRVGLNSLDIIVKELDDMEISALDHGSKSISSGRQIDQQPMTLHLTLHDVGFTYPDSASSALSGISLDIPPGSSLGVCGPSGAGKSTLIDILCGVRTPRSGNFLVNGGDASAANPHWRQSIGLVPQTIFLLDDSIENNVAFGLDVDDELVREALERAQLWEFASTLPQGTATLIGERGTRLSGGQRQRLGIARALYNKPSVLILDEATSALDVENEAGVVEAINSLTGQLTLIVIAHRLSTIKNCRTVAYLEAGTLRGVGSFEELVKSIPEFAHAVDLAGINPS